jgi:hypothetical protein
LRLLQVDPQARSIERDQTLEWRVAAGQMGHADGLALHGFPRGRTVSFSQTLGGVMRASIEAEISRQDIAFYEAGALEARSFISGPTRSTSTFGLYRGLK